MADQSLTFGSDAELLDPRMVGDSFAHVVQLGGVQLLTITTTPWQNVLDPSDVDGSGSTTSLDALTIINELDRRPESQLPPIDSMDDFTGFYLDVSGDGRVSAFDSLLVINAMAAGEDSSESEGMTAGVDAMTPRTSRPATELSGFREPPEPVTITEGDSMARFAGVYEERDQALVSLADEWPVDMSVEADVEGSRQGEPLDDPTLNASAISTEIDLF
jgi:hypothetical protein